MSLAGFMKQVTKTSQFLSEKVGGAEGTEIDPEVVELGQKLDVINESVESISGRTKEYLQPNPNTRAKLALQHVAGKNTENVKYPQVEHTLGESFMKYGNNLKGMTPYPTGLIDLGEAFINMSETKDSMEEKVKQDFLLPLLDDQEKDLKEIAYHRKKLEGRRLDYDYKKRKSDKVTPEELKTAEEKFETSKEICLSSMTNYVESEDEHVSHLYAFSTAIMEYHQECARIMQEVNAKLATKLQEAKSLPRSERKPLTQLDSNLNKSLESFEMIDDGKGPALSAVGADDSQATFDSQRCQAMYDFVAENPNEVGFFAGDVIEIVAQGDPDWWEGTANGMTGFFPASYVQML